MVLFLSLIFHLVCMGHKNFNSRVISYMLRNHFTRKLHVEGQKFKELVLLKTKSLRSFSISNISITANNGALGSRFHS